MVVKDSYDDPSNRILDAINKIEVQLSGKDEDTKSALNKQLNCDFNEWYSFQDTQAIAHASGKINLNEANLLYRILGSSCDHFNEQPLAEKIVVTKVMQELLKWKLGL